MARIKLQTPNFNLSKRGDGIYEIRYTVDGRPASKSTGTRDPKEGEAFRARFAQSFRRPNLSENTTVEELCKIYEGYRKGLVSSPTSLDYSFAPIVRHIGHLFAASITQTVVNDYIKTRSNERPERGGNRWGDKPVGEATINKELRMLRAALNWAASEHKIPRPPNFRIELSSGTARTDWISKEEANKLMGVAPSHLALFLLIALTTAKRREAILSLKWADVALHLPGHESINFGEDVGNKRRGSTPIIGAARLIEALKTAKAVAKTDYVVEFRGRRVMDVKTSMTAACKRAGLRHISAHTLKHSAITWMVQADVPLERIAKFTNTSKEVIEATYGHHSPSFVAEAVNAVAF